VINAWHTELYVAEDHVLAWPELKAGAHVLTFVCQGKDQRSTGYHLGLDTLVLARVATPDAAGGAKAEHLRTGALAAGEWAAALKDADPFVRTAALWRTTQERPLAAAHVPQLTAALTDPSHEARGLAAAALRTLGQQASKALPALAAALKDPDSGVRMMTANALAALGAQAAPALDALIAAGTAPGEHVQVLRSVADALGAIGPPAAKAIPVLEQLRKVPRVHWNAEAAIANVQRR
jgi:HEAT repeat protein